MTATALARRRLSGVNACLGFTVCVPVWAGVQAGRPHTPTNMVRGLGLVSDAKDLGSIVLKSEDGTPVYVRDVAQVLEAPAPRFGAA